MSQPAAPHLLLPAPRLSGVLHRHLTRRFGTRLVDGRTAAQWSAPASWLPGLMALAAGPRVEWMLAEHWRAYGEPSPHDLPCGAWLASDPDPERWVWVMGSLFDRPQCLADRAHAAWRALLAGHVRKMHWEIVEPVQEPTCPDASA